MVPLCVRTVDDAVAGGAVTWNVAGADVLASVLVKPVKAATMLWLPGPGTKDHAVLAEEVS